MGTDCGEPRRTSPVPCLPFLSVWLQREASWLACSTSHPHRQQIQLPVYPYISIQFARDHLLPYPSRSP